MATDNSPAPRFRVGQRVRIVSDRYPAGTFGIIDGGYPGGCSVWVDGSPPAVGSLYFKIDELSPLPDTPDAREEAADG